MNSLPIPELTPPPTPRSTPPVVGVAVVGCGHWGPNHIRAVNQLPGAMVVSVADAQPARLERLQKSHPNLASHPDPESIWSDPTVDAVIICTPTATHFELVRQALLAGKHVLCEKPLCQTSREARALSELAAKQNRVLMVGHVFLFNSALLKIKELLDAGDLGRLRYVSAVRTNLGPIRSDVNAAYDLAAHDIAVFNWIFGTTPLLVSAVGESFLQPGIEDVVILTLKYPNRALATIQASWLNPRKVRQMTFVGSSKMATWDDLNLNSPVALYSKGANLQQETGDYAEFLRISMWDGDVVLPKIQLHEPLRLQNQHFIETIQGIAQLRSGPNFATGVVQVLEAAAESIRNHGAPVNLPGSSPAHNLSPLRP